MKMFDITGKIAVVTGGGTGLGEAAAKALAEAGASLVLCGRNREALERVASEVNSGGGRALPETVVGLPHARCNIRHRHSRPREARH